MLLLVNVVPRSTPLRYKSFIRRALELVDDVTFPLRGSLSHLEQPGKLQIRTVGEGAHGTYR